MVSRFSMRRNDCHEFWVGDLTGQRPCHALPCIFTRGMFKFAYILHINFRYQGFCPKTTIKLNANAAFNDNLPNRHYDKQLSEISS